MKKYNRDLESVIMEVINAFSGQSVSSIANELNSKGILTANGKIWTTGALDYFINSRKERLRANREKSPAVSRLIVEAILTEPTLTDRQRVGMLQGYLNS